VYHEIPPELRALVEPVVEDHGLELVDLDLHLGVPHGAAGIVRITVDSRAGDGRVPVGLCATLSREIGSQLDAADAIAGRYRLEVSSPGLDRHLGREKDFAAACGSEVKLETRRPLDGRRRFRGTLKHFADGKLTVEVDGRALDVPFHEVKKANTVYHFGREDFRDGDARERKRRSQTD
jgi:ribosome maturation factor RimP